MEINFCKLKTVSLLVVLSVMFLSCDRFINLGDSQEAAYEDGLPEDLLEDEKSGYDTGGSESPENGYGDTGNTGDSFDTGNTGDTGGIYYDEDSSAEFSDDDEHSHDDFDNVPEWPKESPFPDDFTNDMCDCGTSPAYNPVCCANEKGEISVFNTCFANCYFRFSEGKICSDHKTGICDSIPTYEEEFDDTDDEFEIPDEFEEYDEDPAINDADDHINDGDIYFDADQEETDEDDYYLPDNECGCYPSDTELLCCYKNSTVLISYCLANCHCNGAYLPCFK